MESTDWVYKLAMGDFCTIENLVKALDNKYTKEYVGAVYSGTEKMTETFKKDLTIAIQKSKILLEQLKAYD